jgi:hypothetical protein
VIQLVNRQVQHVPRYNQTVVLINLESFAPLYHSFKRYFVQQLNLNILTLNINLCSQLRLVVTNIVKFKCEYAIDSCTHQQILVVIELSVVDQADFVHVGVVNDIVDFVEEDKLKV